MSKRTILHVTAGDAEWNPTQEEIDKLTALFLAASLSEDGAVVVTRSGVAVNVLEVNESFDVQVISVHAEPEILCRATLNLTREEAIAWAVYNKCDFKTYVPPPQGWKWTGPGTLKHPSPKTIRPLADLILTPTFTNTEYRDITFFDLKDTTQ